MEQCTSWKANIYSASNEVSLLFEIKSFHHRIHKSPSLATTWARSVRSAPSTFISLRCMRYVIRKPETDYLEDSSINEVRTLKRVIKKYIYWTRLGSSGWGWRAGVNKVIKLPDSVEVGGFMGQLNRCSIPKTVSSFS